MESRQYIDHMEMDTKLYPSNYKSVYFSKKSALSELKFSIDAYCGRLVIGMFTTSTNVYFGIGYLSMVSFILRSDTCLHSCYGTFMPLDLPIFLLQ